MIERIRFWKKLLWATVVGAFSTSLAFPQAYETQRKNREAVPDIENPHWLHVENDTDGDLLSDEEEITLGYDENDRDMNENWWRDGVELGKLYKEIIENLPVRETGEPEPLGIYKIDFIYSGNEYCEVCGEWVNMGWYTIVNPSTGEELDVQKIGLHYMKHGSFTYDGSYNDGRVNVVALASILHDPHLIAVPGDTDADHLTDAEEESIGYDAENPDQDGNWITDGADLARGMAQAISALPVGPLPDEVYMIEYLQYGIETCEICGENVNMGYVEIHNPMTGISIQLPCIALHSMGHESFSYSGSYHQDGRVDLATLKEVLEGE
jgi:hypothetical protein